MHSSGSDSAKVIATGVLLGMTCLIGGLGLPPSVILALGAYFGIKSRNEGTVKSTTKIIQSLAWLVAVVILLIGVYNSYMFNNESFNYKKSQYQESSFIAYSIFACFLAYIFLLEFGWKRPLCRKISTMAEERREAAPIIKRQSMHAYSVSEELTRWKRLLDEGAISPEEYDVAKGDLLRGFSDMQGRSALPGAGGARRAIDHDGRNLRGGLPRAT